MPLIYVKQSDAFVACNSFSITDDNVLLVSVDGVDITLAANNEIRFDSLDVALPFYNWLQTVAEQII